MRLIKHPIRDALLFWLGKRMFKRHEAKKTMRASSRPYGTKSRVGR
jgi:hypothetical protein